MKKIIKKEKYKVTFDEEFEKVIGLCANSREETWISEKFIKTYTKLHELGVAHSVEVWNENQLVGGLYGINLGQMFFGESMFSLESNASKFALIKLSEYLREKNYVVIDCQIHNSHLESMGAEEIKRDEFLDILQKQIKKNVEYKKWKKQQ